MVSHSCVSSLRRRIRGNHRWLLFGRDRSNSKQVRSSAGASVKFRNRFSLTKYARDFFDALVHIVFLPSFQMCFVLQQTNCPRTMPMSCFQRGRRAEAHTRSSLPQGISPCLTNEALSSVPLQVRASAPRKARVCVHCTYRFRYGKA